MRRSFKIVSVLVVLVAILITALPFLFGFAAKRYVMVFAQRENATLGKVMGVNLVVDDYHRGWFHSTADLVIKKKEAGVVRILKTIPLTISHGPFYRVHGEMSAGLGGFSNVSAINMLNLPYKMMISGGVAFNGEYTTFLSLLPKSGSKMLQTMGFKSMLVKAVSNNAANHFDFLLFVRGIHFNDPAKQTSMAMQHFQLEATADYMKDHHWKTVLGFDAGNNQWTIPMHNKSQQFVTVRSDQIQLLGLDFDTQQIPATMARIAQIRKMHPKHPAKNAPAWLDLFQDTLSKMVSAKTQFKIRGLSLTTPQGTINLQYQVSFPTLPEKHNFFDVALSEAGSMNLTIPHLLVPITHPKTKTQSQFALTNFEYHSHSHTIFSRHATVTFHLADVNAVHSPATKDAPFYASDFTYHSQMEGDPHRFSQTMKWDIGTLCFSGNCNKNIDGDLQFLNMNFAALPDISSTTRQMMLHRMKKPQLILAQVIDLTTAYAKLVSSETKIKLTQTLMSPKGKIEVHGQVTWPNLHEKPALTTLLNLATYHLRLMFPAAYVTEWSAHLKTSAVPGPGKTPAVHNAAYFLKYAMQKGYLKKTGDAYTVNIEGVGPKLTINGIPWVMPSPPPPPVQPMNTVVPAPQQPVAPMHPTPMRSPMRPHMPHSVKPLSSQPLILIMAKGLGVALPEPKQEMR